MTRPSPYQRRLIAAVEADPGRDVAHYAAVLGSTVWDVRRSADLLSTATDEAARDDVECQRCASDPADGLGCVACDARLLPDSDKESAR